MPVANLCEVNPSLSHESLCHALIRAFLQSYNDGQPLSVLSSIRMFSLKHISLTKENVQIIDVSQEDLERNTELHEKYNLFIVCVCSIFEFNNNNGHFNTHIVNSIELELGMDLRTHTTFHSDISLLLFMGNYCTLNFIVLFLHKFLTERKWEIANNLEIFFVIYLCTDFVLLSICFFHATKTLQLQCDNAIIEKVELNFDVIPHNSELQSLQQQEEFKTILTKCLCGVRFTHEAIQRSLLHELNLLSSHSRQYYVEFFQWLLQQIPRTPWQREGDRERERLCVFVFVLIWVCKRRYCDVIMFKISPGSYPLPLLFAFSGLRPLLM
jgi:hypothetical protein